ncbi:MAG: DUF5995 family protein [Candidatus Polarisedimenticolia bacterium]
MSTTTRHAPNSVYYFQIGPGVWSGVFSFRVIDWPVFWRSRIGLWNRFITLGMILLQRLLGPARIDSHRDAHPSWGPMGVATNRVRIRTWGVVLYRLDEQSILCGDGDRVLVRSQETFGPIPFLFRRRRRHPARISENGLCATYLDVSLLGDDWEGRSVVQTGHDSIEACLQCRWAEARQVISRPGSDASAEAPLPLGPLDSVDRVVWRLEQYRDWYDCSRDRRAIFTHAYLEMTRRFREAIGTDVFSDTGWVVSLDIAFADQFFAAMNAEALDVSVPHGWRPTLYAMDAGLTSVMEDLSLPMIVHVVHDLPLALQAAGLSNACGESHIDDFHRANDVLQAAIPDIQRQVARRYNPMLAWLDRLGAGEDEILTNYGMRLGRAAAWYNAERYLDPVLGSLAKESVTRSTNLAVSQILRPALFSFRIGRKVLRLASRWTRRWPDDKRGPE